MATTPALYSTGDVFGHIPVFLKKGSLITKWKVEMLDGLFSVQVRCGQLPVIHKTLLTMKPQGFKPKSMMLFTQ